ncbi:hypothetical protein ACHAXT_011094 [Thalassiosira profunda]
MTSTRRSLLAAAALAALSIGPVAAAEGPPAPSNPYPSDFRADDALQFYSVESTSLLKRSMLAAGFSVDETVEVNESYLDFAGRALDAEKRRIEAIRDALKAQVAGDRTCAAEDGSCAAPEAAAEKTKDDRWDKTGEFARFQAPDLQPGQLDLLKWNDDGSIVQDYAARVGLPPQLVPTLKDYARKMGLLEIMENMLYDDPLPPDGAKWFSFQSPYQKQGEMRNFTWNVERPAKKWKSDMHWFNTADELSHEDALRALSKGGFDEVLKAIGEQFGLDTLHVDSIGFVSVTECERGFIHTDWEDVGGRAFNFLVGIESPDDAGPELVVENERQGRNAKGEVYYGSNAGILVGDGTRHGTRECNHRPYKGVRITASIYLADPTKQNLDILAGDTTSIFPPTGDGPGKAWIWTQKGRHWKKNGKGDGLVGDKGRKAFDFSGHEEKGCSVEDCENETDRGRNSCLETCKVFIDDVEYKPGKTRKEVFGY